MATTLALRNTTLNGISVGGSIYYDMVPTFGSASDTAVVDTVASGTEIQWTDETTSDVEVVWVSGAAPSGGFTLTSVDLSIWAQESNMNANCGARARFFERTPGGTETEIGGGPFNDGVEFTTSAAEYTWTANVTDTLIEEDNRLVLKLYITNVGTMAGGHTCTLTFNAASAATGDSFITLAETVTFKPEPISGTLAVTLDALTLSATGTVDIQANAAPTLGALTLSATATNEASGALAVTLGDVTLSATGTAEAQGTLAVTLDALALGATGIAEVSGTLAATLGDVTLAATGTVEGAAPVVEETPSGGWDYLSPRRETAEERRLERERLGIIPAQQKAIDKAARKIAKRLDETDYSAPAREMRERIERAAEALALANRLATELRRPREEMLALALEAIEARLAWMQAQAEFERDEEDVALLLLVA